MDEKRIVNKFTINDEEKKILLSCKDEREVTK